MNDTYREHFVGDAKGKSYDQDQYDLSSYSSLLWELEKSILRKLIEEIRKDNNQIEYLDFVKLDI